MKYIAFFYAYLLAKQVMFIVYQQPGKFTWWFVVIYSMLSIPVLLLPFKLEVKCVWTSALLLDAFAPLAPGIQLRIAEACLLAGWLSTYIWRLVRRSESIRTVWKELRSSVPVNDSPPIEIDVRDDGWTTCPNCGKRFKITFAGSWDGSRHQTCGQRLIVKQISTSPS